MGLLKTEGLVVNKKRTYRLYSKDNLQVRTKKRKKLQRPRLPMLVPTRVNERWSLDFINDQLSHGRCIRVLNIVDDYSKSLNGKFRNECLNQHWFRTLDEARIEIDEWLDHYHALV